MLLYYRMVNRTLYRYNSLSHLDFPIHRILDYKFIVDGGIDDMDIVYVNGQAPNSNSLLLIASKVSFARFLKDWMF